MKRLSFFTIILFALGLYMVPATFATGAATDSQDRYHKDQTGLSSPSQQERQTFPGQLHEQDRQTQPGQLGQQDRQTQPGQLGQQDRQTQLGQSGQQSQQQKLMLVDNLIGTEIHNQQGEQIGEIESVLVDVENGRIGFVTMSSGGIFGMGDDKYIVPFNALQKNMPVGSEARIGMSQQRQVVFTLDKQKDQLKAVPAGDIEEFLTQEGQIRGINEHYGVSPYWDQDQRRQQSQGDTRRSGETQQRPETQRPGDAGQEKNK